MSEDSTTSTNLQLHSFFITPVFSMQINGYNHLIEELQKLKKEDPIGTKGKSTTGWHSDDFCHEREPFKPLCTEIFNLADEAFSHLGVQKHIIPEITGMWGCINQPGSHNKLHNHPYNFLSGVYYLQTPEDSGRIIFHEPKPQAEILSPPRIANQSIHVAHRVNFEPKKNTLLLFPSWLCHEVEENNSQEERIIISFNIHFNRRANANS